MQMKYKAITVNLRHILQAYFRTQKRTHTRTSNHLLITNYVSGSTQEILRKLKLFKFILDSNKM